MLLPRTHLRRIPSLLRPLRPPRPIPFNNSPQLRPFTHNTQLLLLLSSSPTTRPQLPFLHHPSTSRSPKPDLLPAQIIRRLISTERRAYYRRTITGGLKLGLAFYALLLLFYIIQTGVYQERIERVYPTPSEWSLKSRWCLRSARAMMDSELGVSWPRVGGYVRDLVERLESPDIDGAGVGRDGDEGGYLVEGLGRVGLDVSGKSVEWRRGYFEALMCAAKVAENLDGWLKDEVLRIAAPVEYVASPDNPNPKTLPKKAAEKVGLGGEKGREMKMENCSAAYESPEVFYLKVLTTVGFGTREKVDAALAYADWLDFKGLAGTARDMYSWAMDVAVEGVEDVPDVGKVVDVRSGVLSGEGTEFVSENLLRVSTSLAVHHAKAGDLPTALSIFLSLLRARRDINASTPTTPTKQPPNPPTKDTTSPLSSLTSTITSLIFPPAYPPPPPSGNSPPPPSPCEEAALMTYIGEIIFASSSHEAGLAWTRDAVDMAESRIVQLGDEAEHEQQVGARDEHRCTECLQTSLGNWKSMIRTLVTKAENEELALIQNPPPSSSTSLWTRTSQTEKQLREKATQRRRWEAEEMILEERTRRVRSILGVVEGKEALGFMPEKSVFFM